MWASRLTLAKGAFFVDFPHKRLTQMVQNNPNSEPQTQEEPKLAEGG